MPEIIYNPKKLTQELQEAKLPVAGVSTSGRISFSRELSKSERTKSDEIINNHDPESFQDSRLELLKQAGITPDDLLFALWDQVIKGDSSAASTLKSKMNLTDSAMN